MAFEFIQQGDGPVTFRVAGANGTEYAGSGIPDLQIDHRMPAVDTASFFDALDRRPFFSVVLKISRVDNLERRTVDSALRVGNRVHGYAGGYFGRDSYTCRTVEYIGRDYVVFRVDGSTEDDCGAVLLGTMEATRAARSYGERKQDYDGNWCCSERA